MTDKDRNITEEGSTLFSDPEANITKKIGTKKKASALKRQRRAIIIAAAVIAVIVCAYLIGSAIHKRHVKLGQAWDRFEAVMLANLSDMRLSELDNYDSFADWLSEKGEDLVIQKLIENSEDIQAIFAEDSQLADLVKNIAGSRKFANYIDNISEDPEAAPKLLEGEVLGTSNRIYMYDPYDRSQIQSIEVRNSVDEFSFYYNSEHEDFFVEDHLEATYNQELFASLIVSTGKPTVIERAFEHCEDFSEYGLADSQSPASFTVTTRDGVSQTVYIGNMTAAGNGYYARHSERDALYVLAASLDATLLGPLETLITPTLALPMSQADYYTIKNFAVVKDDEITVLLTFLDEDKKNELGMDSSYYMIYPTAYSVNSTSYSEVLTVLTNFQGLRTAVFNPNEEDLAQYGLSKPAFGISYEYNDIKQEIFFSEKNEDGNYYAVSPLFNLIAELDGETMRWLEWELIEWVDDPIFMMNINEIATVTVESSTATRNFDLTGEGEELVITERETKFRPEVQNFRQFYKVLLSTHLQGYVRDDLTVEQTDALKEKTPDLTLTVETRAGKTIVYRFYVYSTLRTYYTVDYLHDTSEAEGVFYIMTSSMNKIISDAEKVMTNTAVDSTARN